MAGRQVCIAGGFVVVDVGEGETVWKGRRQFVEAPAEVCVPGVQGEADARVVGTRKELLALTDRGNGVLVENVFDTEMDVELFCKGRNGPADTGAVMDGAGAGFSCREAQMEGEYAGADGRGAADGFP